MDARLLSVQDVQNPKAYPYERGIGMSHSKICMACNKLIAKWVTRNNDRVSMQSYLLQKKRSLDIFYISINFFYRYLKIPSFFAMYVFINSIILPKVKKLAISLLTLILMSMHFEKMFLKTITYCWKSLIRCLSLVDI